VCSKINACYIFICIFCQICQNSTSNFRKVVWQHTEGVVGSIIQILLEITSLSSSESISKQNPLRTDKVIAIFWCTTFFGTQCKPIVFQFEETSFFLFLCYHANKQQVLYQCQIIAACVVQITQQIHFIM